MIFKIFIGYDERDEFQQRRKEMKPFTQWKELRELVRKSAVHFELSPESEKVALDSALRSPKHAMECYKAIERSYEKPNT